MGRKLRKPAFALVAGAMLAMLIGSAGKLVRAADPVPQGFGVSLHTDRPVYRVGEPIPVVLEIFTRAEVPIRFDFPNAQRFDFIVEDIKGREVWRWSWGRMFAAVLGQQSLGSSNARPTYHGDINASLSPGRYRIRGVLTDTLRSAAAILVVSVE